MVIHTVIEMFMLSTLLVFLRSNDRKLCEELAIGYAQKLESKEQIIRRKGNTKEAKLAQKRRGKAEKSLHRKRDQMQKEKEKR